MESPSGMILIGRVATAAPAGADGRASIGRSRARTASSRRMGCNPPLADGRHDIDKGRCHARKLSSIDKTRPDSQRVHSPFIDLTVTYAALPGVMCPRSRVVVRVVLPSGDRYPDSAALCRLDLV
ncbi:hypothetical protein GCM10010170_099520 [Dactylosporangium salmoneum]|uniref:Uncharacterized protein n=1 Tax=Dactylosporangium salmoneum TaxID=53361 RepID=A0ABP5UUJ9_9ACTN